MIIVTLDSLKNKNFAKGLLDLISQLSGLSVSVYLAEDNMLQTQDTLAATEPFFYISEMSLPYYCKKIREDFPGVCDLCMPIGKEKPFRCKAGLWCKIVPMDLLNGVGYFVIGHRRIERKDKESWEKISDLLDLHGLSRDYAYRLEKPFSEVPIIKESEFDNKLFDNLNILKDIIIERAELLRKDKEISEKIEATAHQLILPMQSIVGYSSNLAEDKVLIDYPDLRRMAEKILQETIKLSHVADTLRNITRDIPGEKDESRESINLAIIINNTIDLFQEEAKQKGVIIKEINFQTYEFNIYASEADISHVFYNLIKNAIKYSYRRKKINAPIRYISLTISKKINNCCIEITNYGVGILEEEIKNNNILKKGYRGKLGQIYCKDGCGQGLATVKEILDSYGGKIEIESKKMGEGDPIKSPYKTIVRIFLPYNSEEDIK